MRKSGISNYPWKSRQNDCHDFLVLPNGTQRSQKSLRVLPFHTTVTPHIHIMTTLCFSHNAQDETMASPPQKLKQKQHYVNHINRKRRALSSKAGEYSLFMQLHLYIDLQINTTIYFNYHDGAQRLKLKPMKQTTRRLTCHA